MRSCVHKVLRQDIQSIEIHCPRSDEIQCPRSHEISHPIRAHTLPNASAIQLNLFSLGTSVTVLYQDIGDTSTIKVVTLHPNP